MKSHPHYSRVAVIVLALGAVLAACIARFAFNDWDAGANLHPDERHLARVVAAIEVPARARDYVFADTSSLNPRNRGIAFYVYGDLPVNLVRLAAASLADLCGQSTTTPGVLAGIACRDATGAPIAWTGLDAITRLGRWLSSVFAVLAVVLTGLIARRVAGSAAGVLATWLAAGCVLAIQLSNFFTVDTIATTLVLASFYCVTRLSPGAWRWALLAGIAAGAAAACKITLLAFVVVPAAGVLATAALSSPKRRSTHAANGLVALIAGAYAGIRLLSPSAFDGWFALDGRWVEDILAARALVAGETNFPPGVQWTGRTPWLFALSNLVTWGMGWPLALAALGGWVAFGREAARRLRAGATALVRDPARRALALAWIWIALWFAWQGGQWVASMRYLLPIYFFLVVFAARGLVKAWNGWPRVPRIASRAGVAALAALSLVWTVAFLGVYAQGHPRLAASAWLTANIAPGAVVGHEHWDDPLPAGDPAGAARFVPVALELYAEDTAAKRERLVGRLESLDYLVLSSNRLVASIPRQPLRYPMTRRYYDLLAAGNLGFEPVARFAAWPRLGPLVFPDQEWPVAPATGPGDVVVSLPAAEEAFGVYDHPQVIVYRKRADFSAAAVTQALAPLDVDSAYHGFRPRAASAAPTGLLFTPGQWRARESAAALATVPAERGTPGHVLTWLAVSLVLGWLAVPVIGRLAPGLADRGASMARILALAAVSLAAWLPAATGLAPYATGSLLVAVAGLALLAVRAWQRDAIAAIRVPWLVSEGVFVTAFLAALVVRAGTPELWHPLFGGEKPMDFAYLNAVLRSEAFPPHDPWFALGFLNYYYFGFVMVSAVTKLAAVPASLAYNLALALWFALLCQAAFGLGYHFAARLARNRPGHRPVVSGLLAALLTGFAGNLVQTLALARGGCRAYSGDPCLFWNASRAIPAAPGEPSPITEFPFFTLLYGDLHAHFLSLPVLLLVVGLALSWTASPAAARNVASLAPRVAWAGLLIAVLYMTNAWDAPVALVLAAGLAAVAAAGGGASRGRPVATTLALLAVLASAAWVGSWPYAAWFATAHGGPAWWHGSRTPLTALLLVFGPFLLPLAASWLLSGAAARGRGDPGIAGYFAAGVVAVLAAAYLLNTVPAWLVVLPVLALAWHLWRRAEIDTPLAWCIAVGLGLVGAVEVVRVGGDVGRMNTVFKFYYHAWALLAIAAAVMLPRLWYLAGGAARATRYGVRAATAAVLACALSYPLFAVPAKWAGRSTPGAGWTLDGAGFLDRAHFRAPGRLVVPDGDRAVIAWLRANAGPVDVIAEGASTTAYSWGARLSVHTGLPTILGWSGHQRQQKSLLPRGVVDARAADVDRLFGSGDAQAVRRILARYHVRYVGVGALERETYDAGSLSVFDDLAARGVLHERFREEGAVIYEVAERAPLSSSVLQHLPRGAR